MLLNAPKSHTEMKINNTFEPKSYPSTKDVITGKVNSL